MKVVHLPSQLSVGQIAALFGGNGKDPLPEPETMGELHALLSESAPDLGLVCRCRRDAAATIHFIANELLKSHSPEFGIKLHGVGDAAESAFAVASDLQHHGAALRPITVSVLLDELTGLYYDLLQFVGIKGKQ